MNTKNVESLITWLAKSGDKETLSKVSELLGEISNFKSKGSVNESRNVQTTQPKLDMASHASSLLDGGGLGYSLFTPKPPSYERNYDAPRVDPYAAIAQSIPQEPIPPMVNDLPYQGGSRVMANNVEMTSHADSLL